MFNDDYEVPSAIYFCVCFNLLLSAFISVLRQKFLIAYLTPLQTFFAHIVLANNSFCLFRTCKLFFSIFLIPSPLLKNNRPSLIDDELVNLIDSVSIWGSPTQFVDVSLSGNHRDLPPISSCFWDKIQQTLLHCRWWFRNLADPLHLLSPPVLSPSILASVPIRGNQ